MGSSIAAQDWLFSLSDVCEALPDATSEMRFTYALRHGTMKLGLYAPAKVDHQEPHQQDELYVIAAGAGESVKNGVVRPFKQQMSSSLRLALTTALSISQTTSPVG
jgi:hypothetical protein